jgi:hypothetical protein
MIEKPKESLASGPQNYYFEVISLSNRVKSTGKLQPSLEVR